MSVITEESRQLLRKFFQAQKTVKLGATLYGPDSSQWPARWYDAVTLIQHEIDLADSAFETAKAKHLSQR